MYLRGKEKFCSGNILCEIIIISIFCLIPSYFVFRIIQRYQKLQTNLSLESYRGIRNYTQLEKTKVKTSFNKLRVSVTKAVRQQIAYKVIVVVLDQYSSRNSIVEHLSHMYSCECKMTKVFFNWYAWHITTWLKLDKYTTCTCGTSISTLYHV